jgi:hypothetical protein
MVSTINPVKIANTNEAITRKMAYFIPKTETDINTIYGFRRGAAIIKVTKVLRLTLCFMDSTTGITPQEQMGRKEA